MARGVKRIFSIMLYIILIAILVNFVPVKFAVKLEDAQKQLEVGKYICVTESKYVFETGWIAKKKINKHLKETLAVKVSRNSPDKYLSNSQFDFKWFEIENRFLLTGEVGNYERNKDTNVLYADLDVDKWEVIYPINRASFRKYFTPPGYLTIYDYDLIKVIKTLL
ncbi:hypothetical protein [Paenibacillus sp. YPG26]|uniref:hypothetical protein n=1 Tax=Paenibacillus sp. YPG26 TaxID=2878915 RepID=UPI00203F69EC|nr:hypothetical protein [Paenibacillus sp. YPG26]USB34367.1 hypothetical protein LDO05_06230 [Paenibacillus sp. YPG26]